MLPYYLDKKFKKSSVIFHTTPNEEYRRNWHDLCDLIFINTSFNTSIKFRAFLRISNYIFLKRRYRQLSGFAGHSFQVRTLKLCMNDHLMGAGDMGYPDIRISASGFFGYLALRAIFLEL